jgi:hypothetical protein
VAGSVIATFQVSANWLTPCSIEIVPEIKTVPGRASPRSVNVEPVPGREEIAERTLLDQLDGVSVAYPRLECDVVESVGNVRKPPCLATEYVGRCVLAPPLCTSRSRSVWSHAAVINTSLSVMIIAHSASPEVRPCCT